MSRELEVDWITRPGTAGPVQVRRRVGWTNLHKHIPDLANKLLQWPKTIPAIDLTEGAALAVMALLISNLEGGVLQEVLPIGSGGDYLVRLPGKTNPTQVEGSGIQQADYPSVSRARLHEKRAQVLTHSNDGYASVTTFAYPSGQPAGPIVHSYLHYVVQAPKPTKGGKKAGKKGKKK